MQWQAILKILGVLLMMFSTSLLPPLVISLIVGDGGTFSFAVALSITLLTGLILWGSLKQHRQEPRLRDGFLIVVLFWSVLAGFGTIPFLLMPEPDMSVTEAFFE